MTNLLIKPAALVLIVTLLASCTTTTLIEADACFIGQVVEVGNHLRVTSTQ